MRRTSAGCLAVFVFLCPGWVGAQGAVPEQLLFNARLTDPVGVPLAGNHAVDFALFDVATGGAPLWAEHHAAIGFGAEGLAFVELGQLSPLSPAVLDGRKLHLELTVDGTVMSPRLVVASVPYALRATTAREAGRLGTLTPDDVQRRVSSACIAGSAIRAVAADGTVTCETSISINTPAGSGLVSSQSAGAVTLGLASCPNGGVLKSIGGGWSCGVDLTLDQATVEGFARDVCFNTTAELTTALSGSYAPLTHPQPWSTLTSVPAGFADGVDNDTVFVAGAGLQIAANVIGVAPTAALTVASVTYSTPRARRLVVGEAMFRARNATSQTTCCNSMGGAFIANGTADGLIAALNLPVGALVTQVTVYYVDNDAKNLTLEVQAHALQWGGYTPLASFVTSGASTTVQNRVIDVPDFTVAATHAYELRAVVTDGGALQPWSTPGYNLEIYGAVVDYRMTEPQ